jgi:hypothetical protein
MAATKFPGPSINRLIDTDPQIMKVPLDEMGWGSRPSMFSQLSGDARSNNPSPPSAPEQGIVHVPSKG